MDKEIQAEKKCASYLRRLAMKPRKCHKIARAIKENFPTKSLSHIAKY